MNLPDQELELMGRSFRIIWKGLPFKPDLERCTQVYGICFTEEGR